MHCFLGVVTWKGRLFSLRVTGCIHSPYAVGWQWKRGSGGRQKNMEQSSFAQWLLLPRMQMPKSSIANEKMSGTVNQMDEGT